MSSALENGFPRLGSSPFRVQALCRMIGLVWRSFRAVKTAAELVKLLAEAASRDPYLESIAGDARHCHGYGFAGFVERDGGFVMVWERFDAADLLGVGEESCTRNLEALREALARLADLVASSSKGVLVAHARRASRGEPRGTFHAHPYLHTVAGRHGYRLIALAHNGGIDKAPLASLLGLDPSSYTDSGILAAWVARQVSYGLTVEEALREARQYTRTALDVLVLEATGNSYRLHVHGYVRRDLGRERIEYYKPYTFDASELQGYASSTIVELAQARGLDLGALNDDLDKHIVLEL